MAALLVVIAAGVFVIQNWCPQLLHYCNKFVESAFRYIQPGSQLGWCAGRFIAYNFIQPFKSFYKFPGHRLKICKIIFQNTALHHLVQHRSVASKQVLPHVHQVLSAIFQKLH
jgi:hypothetical protein